MILLWCVYWVAVGLQNTRSLTHGPLGACWLQYCFVPVCNLFGTVLEIAPQVTHYEISSLILIITRVELASAFQVKIKVCRLNGPEAHNRDNWRFRRPVIKHSGGSMLHVQEEMEQQEVMKAWMEIQWKSHVGIQPLNSRECIESADWHALVEPRTWNSKRNEAGEVWAYISGAICDLL